MHVCLVSLASDVDLPVGQSARAPGGTSMDLGEVAELTEAVLVAQWDVDDAVVDQGGEGVHGGGLLSTSQAGGRLEDAGDLAIQCSRAPEGPGRVPECLWVGQTCSDALG